MSLTLRTDVTSVKLYNNIILAGIGSYIIIFDKNTAKLLQRIPALSGQKIYGFVENAFVDHILVYGGKQFTVVCLKANDATQASRLFAPVVCDDWIHSAIWENEHNIAVLTAHNVVQVWDTANQTLYSKYTSKDNSILYSGLLLQLQDGILVFAGTVFSDVIVHMYDDAQSLHNLKGHRGVIFSISCCLKKNIIVTTSDDRSIRIWGVNNKNVHLSNTRNYWVSATVDCLHELYGHTARVMRNCVTDNHIVSVGEDSAICFWDLKGKLARKIMSNHNGSIWSVDKDKQHLVTGGGDSSVILHPLTVATDYGYNEIINLVGPKKLVFTAKNNVVILTDSDEVVYYNVRDKVYETICILNHESTYKMLSISSCKQIIAITDMSGNLDIFIENCKENHIRRIVNMKLGVGKILSMQWANNRYIVLCSREGVITVLASTSTDVEIYAKFTLPPCKERWLTSAAIDAHKDILVLGDRCGNIHVYHREHDRPIKTFNKVHGRYGPTSINIENDRLTTTGRDGSIKYFAINEDKSQIKYMKSNDLEFPWVEKFLDNDKTLICGFHERIFVVYSLKDNMRFLEVPCGGGHRAWDAVRYIDKVGDNYDKFIRLAYIKSSDINLVTFQMSRITSLNIINGSHCKEINCLKTYRNIDENIYYVSGGEDTTLRISCMDKNFDFKDETIFKHLSNVKTLKIIELNNDNRILIVSAGGRAQICANIVEFKNRDNIFTVIGEEIVNFLIKGTDKERKGGKTWRDCSVDFDPETRIMDLDVKRIDDNFIIYAGCSDAYLRKFELNITNINFKSVGEFKYHDTCILKTVIINLANENIILTCSTRGEVSFWKCEETLKPFFSIKTNKSGINSVSSNSINENQLLIATGGDDNSIHLKLLQLRDQFDLSSLEVCDSWSVDNLHNSQITGVVLLKNYLISTSIDQRISLCTWGLQDGIQCKLVNQVYSDVADIQGLDILNVNDDNITICVYGKGLEVMDVPTKL